MLKNKNFVVSVRKRPSNIIKEYNNKNNKIEYDDVISTTNSTVSVHEKKQKVNLDYYESVKTFKYDYVFSDFANNLGIYKILLKKKIELLKNIICYTFGETGSGKTHTLFGKHLGETREFGLVEASLYDLLKQTKNAQVTAFEIYNNKLYDLIANDLHQVEMYEKAGEINVVGLSTFECVLDNVHKLIDTIMENRRIGISSENDRSSRSHVVIKIQSCNIKMIFVDVAGCERGNYLRIDQDIRDEMININKDNFALKECMRSILYNKQNNRIPFRLSKITMALKESFYDHFDTVVITTITPKKSNIPTTLNILNYVNDFKMYTKLQKPISNVIIPVIYPTLNKPKTPYPVEIPNVEKHEKKQEQYEIIKQLIKLNTEEKIIYEECLTNNIDKILPDICKHKLNVVRSQQIRLLEKLNLFK